MLDLPRRPTSVAEGQEKLCTLGYTLWEVAGTAEVTEKWRQVDGLTQAGRTVFPDSHNTDMRSG